MSEQIQAQAQQRHWRSELPLLVERAFSPNRANAIHWATWALTLGIVLALSAILLEGRVFAWEQDLAREVQALDYPGWLYQVTNERMTDVESIQGLAMVFGIAGAFWLARSRVDAGLLVLTLPLHVLGNFPKAFVDRDRPSDSYEGMDGFGGSMSFTSGHSEFVVTFWGFLLYLLLLRVTNPVARAGLVGGWLALVLSVALGRLHEGAHWPLDVAGGMVVGIGLVSGLIWLRRHLTGEGADALQLRDA
jgi:membrane-associated phospholipid phosphatase